MRLLVLGGTHHVGRAVVETALARGDEVTTLNRGVSRPPTPDTQALVADRTDHEAVRAALGGQEWDAAIDTWAGAPRAVRDAARLLADRVGHYGYVSSHGVYQWPWPSGADERAPLVTGDPGSDDGKDYAAAKRGAELAVLEAFGDRALLARSGGIIGPYEDVGRIPWWMRRIERGGRVLAPGRPETPLQFIDARDIAVWMLSAADRGLGGAFNVNSRPASTTMGELLHTLAEVLGSDAELVWADSGLLEREGLMLGMEFGLRYPGYPSPTGIHDADTSAAHAAGLVCRPLRETLADTWAWLRTEGDPRQPAGTPPMGSWSDTAAERRVLDLLTAS
ncbi:NAD-dependent epimerase/dehydratase family protein [Pseudonocardia humida]|uniref:NAD-dependent epimerase/dehydratase family protein n=1 Tax=Pseudonocardia humida TaxID=2800819 RepID=A0ABT1ADQ9_9PSEU|nr:NAD-dependent epimerase/dehydratase family protein [Pseudonocardia humida]MCO1660822.1 NAD-dependent epimerase/dehydratase family protein [Pseudonocardia humida]MCO1661040.1 NAD-dependent epimerase/dehydratase family protein [Pseudonocardia humida]